MKVKELLKFLENQDPEGEIYIIADGKRFKPNGNASSVFNSYAEIHDTTLYANEVIPCNDCKGLEGKYWYPSLADSNKVLVCGRCLIKRRKGK